MRHSRSLLLPLSTIASMICAGLWSLPGLAQEAGANGNVAPNITGTGKAGHVAVWTSSTNLGNSSIFESSAGRVGIGTTAPAALLEVNGNARVDGNLTLSGSILASGGVSLIWANDVLFNFSAGLGALPPAATGPNNAAVGDSALQANTTGNNNVATGYQAMHSNTSGQTNTASGTQALYSNTTGSGNTANGYFALYTNTTGCCNVADGYNVLLSNTGSFNTASGQAALEWNATGSFNTASGSSALTNNTTGNGNIAIGNQAGFNVSTTSNNIHVGNQGTATDSGTIRIGTAGTQTAAFIAGIRGVTTGNNNAIPVLIDSNGQLGTMSSSRRYKEDIKEMGDASSGLLRLRPVTFRYKKAFDDGSKPVQYGLIAEEVAEVYPDLVARSADGQIETVKYQVLDSMLLNELQKQNATITAQKEQIRAQEQRISAQEQQNRSLEERLARVEAALNGTTVTAAAR